MVDTEKDAEKLLSPLARLLGARLIQFIKTKSLRGFGTEKT
ncbi:MAG: hypothetical protein RR255_00100 [Bacilli bacterium]